MNEAAIADLERKGGHDYGTGQSTHWVESEGVETLIEKEIEDTDRVREDLNIVPPSKEVVLRTRIFPSTFKTNEDILLHPQSRGILQTFVWVGGKFVLAITNVCKISRSLGSCSFARFRRIIFKLGKSSLLMLRRFERCQRIFAKWSPSKLSVHLRIDIKNCEELTTPFYFNQ